MCTKEIEQARHWLFHRALPFWADAGVDRVHGGFHEALDPRGRPAAKSFRRLRVTCRQIYTFSHAATLGWSPGIPLAQLGWEYLRGHGWMGDDGGWARLLTPRGAVLDATPDLYDHAFVLFALGWLHRASGDPEALVWAHRTLDFIDAHLRHPTAAGFRNARMPPGARVPHTPSTMPRGEWRLQNPHMHLLEAALVLYETSGHARFAELAREVTGLFQTRFFDVRTGTLGEAFTVDWARAPGAAGRVTEPGHHFEWAWILANYERLLGQRLLGGATVLGGATAPSTAPMARDLVAFAERFGVDRESGRTFNSVRDDGVVLDVSSRVWPNTERIKGHIALFDLYGTDPRVPLAQSTRVLLDTYLSGRPAGTWMDHVDGAGRPVASDIPTSTFYHVFLAIAELIRVAPALRAYAAPLPNRPADLRADRRAASRPTQSQWLNRAESVYSLD